MPLRRFSSIPIYNSTGNLNMTNTSFKRDQEFLGKSGSKVKLQMLTELTAQSTFSLVIGSWNNRGNVSKSTVFKYING